MQKGTHHCEMCSKYQSGDSVVLIQILYADGKVVGHKEVSHWWSGIRAICTVCLAGLVDIYHFRNVAPHSPK